MNDTPPSTVASTRPYLIRALHEWCSDNGFTPYLAVSVDGTVRVPMEYVRNDEIVLNVGFDATSGLTLGNEWIEFKARFGGVARDILVPVDRVLAIYARENGQGMAFPVPPPRPVVAEPRVASEPASGSQQADRAAPADSPASAPVLRLAAAAAPASASQPKPAAAKARPSRRKASPLVADVSPPAVAAAPAKAVGEGAGKARAKAKAKAQDEPVVTRPEPPPPPAGPPPGARPALKRVK